MHKIETAPNISIKYASQVPCHVWKNPCSLTKILQYETAICSFVIFLFYLFVPKQTFFKTSVRKWFFSKGKSNMLICSILESYKGIIVFLKKTSWKGWRCVILDLMKDRLKMVMHADDVSVLLSKNTLLLFAFLKSLSCTNASDKCDLWSVCLQPCGSQIYNMTFWRIQHP